MPGSRVPSVEKILDQFYGDIDASTMDRRKANGRGRRDSRYGKKMYSTGCLKKGVTVQLEPRFVLD